MDTTSWRRGKNDHDRYSVAVLLQRQGYSWPQDENSSQVPFSTAKGFNSYEDRSEPHFKLATHY